MFSTAQLTSQERPIAEEKRSGTNSSQSSSEGVQDDGKEQAWPKGWRPYVAVIAGFFMMFNSWGLINAFGAFLGHYEKHLLPAISAKELTLIGSTQCFLILALSPFAGRLLDAKKHTYLGFAGWALLTAGFSALSFTSGSGNLGDGTYWSIWLCSAVAAVGMSCFFTYSSQNVTQWFPHHRYVVVGITSCGAAAAGMVYPLTIKFLIANFGFPTAVRYFTIMVSGTTAIAFLGGIPNPAIAKRPLGPVFWPSTWIDEAAARNRVFWWYTASVFFIFMGYYALPFLVTIWAQKKGLGTIEDVAAGTGEMPGDSGFRSFWFLVIMNGTSCFGRVAGGSLCSRFHNPITTHAVFTLLGALLALFYWPFTPNTAAAICFSVLYGIASGAIIGLPPMSIADIVPPTHSTYLGGWTGLMYLATAPAALVGPMIGGEVYRRCGVEAVGWWTGGCFMGAVCAMGAACWYKRAAKGPERSEEPDAEKGAEG